MAELNFQRVSKTLGDNLVLRDVDFQVADGTFYALLGPSGSGKTTVLRVIAGFLEPDEGAVIIDGADVTNVPVHKRNMGLVFQSYALFPHLSVRDNIAFGLKMRKRAKTEIESTVDEALELVGIQRLAERRPRELSGGEQQRVALARALVIHPTLLLLDEPLSALDRKIRQELQVELKRVQRQTGITTLIVTHDQEEALYLADELLVLDAGVVRQIGTPAEVYLAPKDVFVAGFLGASNVWEGALRRTSDGWRAEIGAIHLPVGEDEIGDEIREGPCTVTVRPERVSIATTGHTVTAGGGAFEGRVQEIELVGPLARIRLDAGGVPVSSLQLSPSAAGLRSGMNVRVSIAASDVHVYPSDGEDAP